MLDKLQKRTEIDALQWKLLQAFLGRSIGYSQCDRSVSVTFKTELEAEQFLKLMQEGGRGR